MSAKIVKRRLEVVAKARRKAVELSDFVVESRELQASLFVSMRPNLLIFVHFPEVSEDEFCKALEYAKPSTVFELRHTPRFDIGRLSRKAVFRYFHQERTRYLDITSMTVKQDDGSSVLYQIGKAFQIEHVRFDRPVMFLLNSFNMPSDFSSQITALVAAMERIRPEVLSIPTFSAR